MPSACTPSSVMALALDTSAQSTQKAPLCTQVFAGLARRQLASWAVAVTYVQIYNEAFQDLLRPETPAPKIAVSDQKRAPWPPQSCAGGCYKALDAIDTYYCMFPVTEHWEAALTSRQTPRSLLPCARQHDMQCQT